MLNVQDVFDRFYPQYQKVHPSCGVQQKAAFDIMNCRTSVMGGHISECDDCGHIHVSYNSCRNRHCPLCQSIPKEKWIDARKEDLLSAPYFHTVFTIPSEIKMLVFQNQKLLYTLLYKTVAETLMELSADPEYLGAQIGFIALLHTWTQCLDFHPHIHVIILAGGLTDHLKWRSSSRKFFISVKVLGEKFRGKFLHHLRQYYSENKLNFYGDFREFENPEAFSSLVKTCYKKSWYVYSKRPFSGPQAVIEYLGRYTHRVAISNNRLQTMDANTVTFKYRDRETKKDKVITLSGVEFVRRFLMHVLPKGFVKIRHYGILANRNKKTKLKLCRKLTRSTKFKSQFKNLTTAEIVKKITGKDIGKCPVCSSGNMVAKLTFHRPQAAPS